MKIDDSGMPKETYWNSLFDLSNIFGWMNLAQNIDIAEIGCGYGTFTVPIAQNISGKIFAFDIDPMMVKATENNLFGMGFHHVHCAVRDVLEKGTGLDNSTVDVVLLFNMLHFAERRLLLAEAERILRPNGKVFVIHWRKDIPTPRGPNIELRPDLPQIISAIDGTGLRFFGNNTLLEPYHWGVELIKHV